VPEPITPPAMVDTDDEARRGYVGGNAARHWCLTIPEGSPHAE